MPKRLGLALATLAAGAGLLAAAALGSGASTPQVLKIGTTGNLDSIDPAIAYGTTSWMFENATGANLFRSNSSGLTVPEVAKRFTVSKNGRVYRIFLRKGFRFSDGQPVRAASFAYAIKRALNRTLNAPGAGFLRNKDIYVRGASARGLTLTVKLARANPNLLNVLTMPFFQAASSKLPLTKEAITVRQVGDLPTAGPYTWSYNAPNERANIVRNPYYTGTRGRHVDEVELDESLASDTCFDETKANQLDIGCVPPNQIAAVAQEYGVSRTRPVGTGRFWVKSGTCNSTLAFNQRRLFANNLPLRQALNWAVDRTALARAGRPAPYPVTPWTHLIPPGFPGVVTARRLQPYSLTADLAKARQLAAGHIGDGSIRVAYQSAGTVGPLQAEAVRQALVDLGFDPSRIEMHGYPGFEIYEAIGIRGTPLDLAVGVGYCADISSSSDPASFIDTALNGDLRDFSPANAAYSKAFRVLSRTLKGKARLRALGRFDVQMMKNLAPMAVLGFSQDMTFFSDRVDPASLAYLPGIGWSLTALRLK